MSQLRVFIVDDHPVVRNGLRTLIADEEDMELVGEACDGETAVRQSLVLKPDVVVMDVSMPGMSGIEAAGQIHKCSPEIRIVALTVHEERGYLQQLLAAGASGYVLKRSAGADLIGAIRHAAAGNMYVDPFIAAQLVTGPGAMAEGAEFDLSEREIETLKQIAQGYSNKQIATRLDLSVKTVETYKARAMEKLGARSRVDLVRYAVGRGWLTGGQTTTDVRPEPERGAGHKQ